VREAKDKIKKQRKSIHIRKISPTNRFEPTIEFKKDEERAEKAKYFQSSDQDESNNNR
jgi:hypothetical protein